MKILDKLKNALFEEEYIEVEEKKEKKEKPIAKKMILPEQRKEKKEEAVFEEDVKEEEVKEEKKTFKFPAITEDDFVELDNSRSYPKREEVKQVVERKEVKEEFHPAYSPRQKEAKPAEVKKAPYGAKKEEIKIDSYGTYEKKETKKTFHPSPVISPIYGLIDSSDKKEEVPTKKEVRISGSYSSRKLDVDSVRAKAYGGGDDIFDEELSSNGKNRKKKQVREEEYVASNNDDDTNSMLDINDDTPAVPKVTVGDAEEYFEDLGLEYNVDYKDISHERKTGRRSDLRHKEEKDEELEDNLFDLFDSMYDDNKEN